jgi:hypothetical protein
MTRYVIIHKWPRKQLGIHTTMPDVLGSYEEAQEVADRYATNYKSRGHRYFVAMVNHSLKISVRQ